MEQQGKKELNIFLETLNTEYKVHKNDLDKNIKQEKELFNTFKQPSEQDEEQPTQTKQFGNNIDRELDLWGMSNIDFSLMDRESFRTSGKQIDKINERLNERHDYPKVLPFKRQIPGFQIRPQRSIDLEKQMDKKNSN